MKVVRTDVFVSSDYTILAQVLHHFMLCVIVMMYLLSQASPGVIHRIVLKMPMRGYCPF